MKYNECGRAKINLQLRNSFVLALAALIWGASFVAQSTGGDVLGPFGFNGIRCFMGAAVLVPVILIFDRVGNPKKPVTSEQKKKQWRAGILCGLVLFFATTCQQYGITAGTDSGKAGFITAFYILLVPILGLFLKKKTSWNIWISVAIAIVALYFLCVTGEFGVATSDLIVLACSLGFSVQILMVDKYSPELDGLRLSATQFLTCGVLSIVPAVVFDMAPNGIGTWFSALGTWDAMLPLLYSGVMSCGVAYTLQIIGQNGLNPTIASLIMSMESVFAVLTGWIVLDEKLSLREGIGCILMMCAIVLAQLRFKKRRK